ncbi:hypothetical protein [Poseidonibacter ostreae]|jgi:hypothetical protein|uniref:Uncharacterized protein n=1 Tax=Poseidonibacter ostreae TaxID=2654171 RepID=A0A6L4WUM6_9BACT|nr:hypothetical protein [Poseidonibacter ostreae]KAB7884681.1 hypothetical protein GA417_10740 [Poseidonibacter ostreae]KAB7889970.1 hypothetical protein GBG19_04365 [Poseidonibacter ostreae]KAB7891484.1 hypothetical protein GBG18_06925 [Poseidonibacter ostreae]MAC83096.1 hypothetical protein [Arcobacter sp.]|tara:strand:+ start:3016 stop:3405 length:390 start_codon:yes stop_codon:yes gene_type:complete
MKKIILASALVISTTFAFDIKSAVSTVGGAMGITAESIGKQLTDIVKAKSPATAEQAKSLCTQASTYKSFVGIADDGMMAKAIDICAEKSSEGLEGKVNEVKDQATSEAAKATTSNSSLMDTATKLLGN